MDIPIEKILDFLLKVGLIKSWNATMDNKKRYIIEFN